jgi:TonB family protein
MASRYHVNPFDLLGQEELYPIAVELPGSAADPKLSIAWNSFHQNFFSELGAFLTWTRVPKETPDTDIFRDCRVQRSLPLRAVLVAGALHVAFFVVPWPDVAVDPKHNPAFDNAQLTWSGPIEDFPLLNVPKHSVKTARAKVQDVRAEGSEAFHPRQRIFTDPVHANHPRQTLVRPKAPTDAPKFASDLPNMVQLAATPEPVRPKLEINEQTLAKLRPRQTKHEATTNTPTDAPNLENHPADMSLSSLSTSEPERPKLEINAGSAPRMAEEKSKGENAAAPELATGTTSETIIALSSSPAKPSPAVEVPNGNLAARIAMSPEGKGTGNGRGNGNNEGAGASGTPSPVGVSISGGNPKPNASIAGNGGKLTLPRMQTTYTRPDPNADPIERTGPPNFATLPPGAPPEQIFSTHRIYSLNVNMPNFNSATGSWIIRFAEMRAPGVTASGELTTPVPVRKVDPKYPLEAIQEHIQGEVILYGVIRGDGSVDSIQLVRGIDKELNANSVAAFAQWKFQPATRGGQPVPLEAIVHIPFRGKQE